MMNQSTKALLWCGIISAIVYVGMNIIIPFWYQGYDWLSQTISELSAIEAPTRLIWTITGFIYTILLLLFGTGVYRTAAGNRPLRFAGRAMIVYAVTGFIWPLTPMHQREALAAGEGTLTDTLHLVMASLSVLLMITAMLTAARAIGRPLMKLTIGAILIFLFFGILTGVAADDLQKDLPTPLLGLWERIMIGVFNAWIILVASLLLRKYAYRPG